MTVLVTGAGGAIGGAVARELLLAGREVLAQDLREETLADLAGEGAATVAGDLRAPAGRAALAAALEAGPLEGVVAAHGVPGSVPLAQLDEAVVRRILTVNAATIPVLYALAEARLADARGAFVAIASQAGLRGEPGNAAYCASKFAVVGWARAIAPAALARGIRVRALCPGRTESPLLTAGHTGFAERLGISLEAFESHQRTLIPAGRFGRPEELARAARLLLDARGAGPVVLAVTGGEVPW